VRFSPSAYVPTELNVGDVSDIVTAPVAPLTEIPVPAVKDVVVADVACIVLSGNVTPALPIFVDMCYPSYS
jgi:hypothetical protein